jgi:hypothetical protein
MFSGDGGNRIAAHRVAASCISADLGYPDGANIGIGQQRLEAASICGVASTHLA